MTDTRERGAVVSGIGISRIGRKTENPGLELTLESSRAAIADAGLEPGDIGAIATMGETPIPEVEQALGITTDAVAPVPNGGLLAPLMGAFLAVTSGAARHVLVYRTVKMMGGSILPSDGAPPRPKGTASTGSRCISGPVGARVCICIRPG